MLMEFGVLQCEAIFPEFKLAWLARTTRNNLPRELDFLHEAENADKARHQLKHFKWLFIPKNYYEYSTKRVLVMEYMPGIQVNDRVKIYDAGISPEQTVDRMTEMYSEMIFNNG